MTAPERFAPVERLVVRYAPEPGGRQTVGRLARRGREILFEYDPAFAGLELSPFKLPVRPGVFSFDPGVFEGLAGVFEDSLPDGWGRLLVDRRIAQAGLSPSRLGPLDRLAWVGTRSMGALVYEPELGLEPPSVIDLAAIAREAEAVLDDAADPGLERLIALGGSPQGARPKALVQLSPDGGTLLYGAEEIRPGYTPYLVKFRARGDPPHAGALEHAYALMAVAAGVDMPRTRLLGKGRGNPGYFAAERFDRKEGQRIHLHTLSGLLHAPHTYPAVTYRDLLLVTRRLTRSERHVAEMFRRACFNVLAHNRDDHSRNFAFLMAEDGSWRPSPAYDLTLSTGPGGEHAMLVGGEGRDPGRAHLLALAVEVGLRGADAIVDQVAEAVRGFRARAEEAGVPRRERERVARMFDGPGRVRSRRAHS